MYFEVIPMFFQFWDNITISTHTVLRLLAILAVKTMVHHISDRSTTIQYNFVTLSPYTILYKLDMPLFFVQCKHHI